MKHNMTVTVESDLWEKMNEHKDIRWSVVMKGAIEEKLEALTILDRLTKNSKLSEKEINDFAISLGKKISKRK